MKKTKLSNLNITHISLVKSGANGKKLIYKSSDDKATYEKVISIAKNDEERGVIYGIVYSPDEIDTQGEFANANEISKAAYAFMKGLNGSNVDREHNFKPDGAYVAESWLVREGDALFKSEKVGSWAVAIQLESEELKEAVKKGEIAGISMAGTGEREEVEKSDESSIANAIMKGFNAIFKEFKGEKMDSKKDVNNKGADEATLKVLNDGFEKLGTNLTALIKRVETLENALKNSKQSDSVGKSDDFGGIL